MVQCSTSENNSKNLDLDLNVGNNQQSNYSSSKFSAQNQMQQSKSSAQIISNTIKVNRKKFPRLTLSMKNSEICERVMTDIFDIRSFFLNKQNIERDKVSESVERRLD